ncbi:MAG: glutamate-1-semialdehyde 2,1-aminomutase [Candidatus Omnitrophota bacterium]|nr:glutamate-1-semialdehyde 2,1-aminomutase [Candidatus Omnitrophota bacterium]
MVEALNKELFRQAKRYIAGGVNSPIRALRAVNVEPIFIKSALGTKIYSEDGLGFIDYCQSFGALILGHAHPKVIKELNRVSVGGTSFSLPTKLETKLAQFISKAIPSIERIRLTNSGTEAVMSAIRLARAFTKKDKIIKFAGSYHGHADYLLDCPGVPLAFKEQTLVAEFNDIRKVKELIKHNKNNIAAIIVEPVAANMGVVLAQNDFLRSLEKLSKEFNIVLIFDEVITGFRLIFGGAQKLFKIKPDLTCLGKIIGGGLPVGAFGGRKEIMQLLAPEGKVYQAGTFSGNPLTVSAGLNTLKILSKNNYYNSLECLTRYLCEGIKQRSTKYGIKLKINFIGSMFSLFFAEKEVMDYNIAKTQNIGLFKSFYQGLLKQGIYFSPSPFEANFVSTAHTPRDIEKTLKAVDKTFRRMAR